jgi:ABC-type transporter Mla subunit MlaD
VRRLLSIGFVVAAIVAAAAFAGASGGGEGGRTTYTIEFDNAFGLSEGGDFRVGGVKAGRTSKFDVVKRKGERALARVTAEVTQPGFGDFRKDASCEIKPQSLIGEYYVDCQPGTSHQKLASDGTEPIPVDQTSSTIPVELVQNVMRRPYRERFRLILTELGTGLAGRPEDLNEVVRRAHPGLRETSRVLEILGRQNRTIENFISDSDTVVAELEDNKRDVVRWVKQAGEAAEITATRRESLRQSFRKLPTFLGELEPTMARLGELADQQTPLLADLQRAAPALDTFVTRVGPFSEATRPALRSLGKASEKGTAAINEGKQEIDTLVDLAPEAQPTFKPLRQFLESMDDRRRALEDDPRAKQGSPPAPDPTAIPTAGGFTGLEAIWNYFFWQGLALNGFDHISHVLRVSVTATPCSPLDNSPDPNSEHFKQCSQWLGPDLPGLTTPDFTEDASPARARRQADRPARRVGERRAPGEPDAGPLPGQRDISKPRVTVPPGVQDLLDDLPRAERKRARERLDEALRNVPGAPTLPGPVPAPSPSPSPAPQPVAPVNELLDFLLAP